MCSFSARATASENSVNSATDYPGQSGGEVDGARQKDSHINKSRMALLGVLVLGEGRSVGGGVVVLVLDVGWWGQQY